MGGEGRRRGGPTARRILVIPSNCRAKFILAIADEPLVPKCYPLKAINVFPARESFAKDRCCVSGARAHE